MAAPRRPQPVRHDGTADRSTARDGARATLEARVAEQDGRLTLIPDDEGVWSITVEYPLRPPVEIVLTASDEDLETACARVLQDLDAAITELDAVVGDPPDA